MAFTQTLGYALQALTDPVLLLCLAAGVFLGIYVGAIPGLSVTMATSLLISFTYSWATLPALAAMVFTTFSHSDGIDIAAVSSTAFLDGFVPTAVMCALLAVVLAIISYVVRDGEEK